MASSASSANVPSASTSDKPGQRMAREKVVPSPLRLWDILTAVKTLSKANIDDPMNIYVTNTTDRHSESRVYKAGRILVTALQMAITIFLRYAWTIKRGRSVLLNHRDDPMAPPPLFGRAVRKLLAPIVQAIRVLTRSKEQLKRMNEFQKKFGAAVQEALGSRVDSMLEVGGLATHPDWQGHGYATALIRTVTDNGDRTNRSCWLGSSNTVNRGFYRSLGFEIVHTFQLGDDNPDWHEKPVLFDIMVRELKQNATGDIV